MDVMNAVFWRLITTFSFSAVVFCPKKISVCPKNDGFVRFRGRGLQPPDSLARAPMNLSSNGTGFRQWGWVNQPHEASGVSRPGGRGTAVRDVRRGAGSLCSTCLGPLSGQRASRAVRTLGGGSAVCSIVRQTCCSWAPRSRATNASSSCRLPLFGRYSVQVRYSALPKCPHPPTRQINYSYK